VRKIEALITNGYKSVLIGANPRSGKTYCIGGVMSKHFNTKGSLNALIVTPAPTETITQFTTELF
jgi:hypothetical protein